MKLLTITKIGYTCGVYGCTGEYFQVVTIDTDRTSPIDSVIIRGMYGIEDRVRNLLIEKGYTMHHVPCVFGKLTRSDYSYYNRHIKSEGHELDSWIVTQ